MPRRACVGVAVELSVHHVAIGGDAVNAHIHESGMETLVEGTPFPAPITLTAIAALPLPRLPQVRALGLWPGKVHGRPQSPRPLGRAPYSSANGKAPLKLRGLRGVRRRRIRPASP